MEITIKIKCESISEFYTHLKVITTQVQNEARRLKLNPARDEFEPESGKNLSDDNCYGSHEVIIKTK